MTEEERSRDARVREQLRNHELPKEWAQELGCSDDGTILLMIWLEELSRRIQAAHLSEVRREGLAYSEARLLWYLLLAGPPYRSSPTRLNENLELTSGGITKTVDRLEARGLVERQPDSDDRRSIQVGLTNEGVEAGRRIARAFTKRYEELAGPLGPDQTERAVQTLRALLDAIDEPL